ncbi:putative membrane protein [Babesia divergens]|uniref:Membrane protein n=1 Tax=Babesia divergens TaxID=32595 RepID=A0AAD9G6K1_BABDI|nr:putative membrane protein [Babesia divergens]
MNAFWLLLVCSARLATVLCARRVVLDIANVDEDAFTTSVESNTRYTIVAKPDCVIGDIVKASKVIAEVDGNALHVQHVAVERVSKDEYRKHIVMPQCNDEGNFEVVEIESVYHGVTTRRRLFLSEDDTYVDFEETYDDFDICSENFEHFVQMSKRQDDGTLTRYEATKYRRIGEIRCGSSVLLSGDNNIFARYAEIFNHKWSIYTVPYIGRIFKTEFIPAVWKDGKYRCVDEGSYLLDLSLDPSKNYRGVVSGCGEGCMFFDGCSHSDFRIVDVVNRHGVIYMGHKAKCIDVKLQKLGNENFVTVYARLLDGTHETVQFVSKDDQRYVNHRPNVVNLELTDEKWNEHISVTIEGDKKVFSIPAPENLRWTIGAVTYKGTPLVGQAFLENPDDVPYVVLGRRIVVEGEFTTIESETDREYPTNTTYVTNDDGIWIYNPKPIQLNLANLGAKNANFEITKIGESRYHITTAKAHTKIGTIRFGNHIIRPNQYYTLETQIVYGGDAFLATTQVADNLKFYSWYSLSSGLFGEKTRLFIEQQKQPIHLALQDVFTGRLPDSFCKETYGNFLRIYLCKNLFTNTMGDVGFGNSLATPYSRYYEWREAYVSMDFFLSSVIVKSYTAEGECVVEPFTQRMKNGNIIFVREPKKPISIDLSPDATTPPELNRVQDDNTFFYRVRPEFDLYYRIGQIMYKDKLLVEDDDDNLSRIVDLTVDSSTSEPHKYTIRVADVSSRGKRARLFTTDAVSGVVHEADKKALTLDVSFGATRDPSVIVKQHKDMLSFHVPWTRTCDYKLDQLVVTHGAGDTYTITSGNDFDQFPEVRLHKADVENDVIAALSSEGEQPVYTAIKKQSNSIIGLEVEHYGKDTTFLANYGDV